MIMGFGAEASLGFLRFNDYKGRRGGELGAKAI